MVGCDIMNFKEKSKTNEFWRLVFGLGIPLIGQKAAKLISEHFLNIDEVISVKEVQYVGIEAFVFLCRATVEASRWLVELKYTVRTHTWCLMRKVI